MIREKTIILIVMSNSYVPLKPVRVVDPVTEVDAVKSYAVLQGGSKISFKAYTSTSISNSSIQFSCPPPSGQIIVDRNIMITLPVRLTFSGNLLSTSGAFTSSLSLLSQNRDAPRAFPFSSALDTLQIGINNDSVSMNMSDIIHCLTRYNIGSGLRGKEYSTTPNYPDQSYNYEDLFGDIRNPLGDYGAGHPNEAVPRGGFPFTIVSNEPVLSSVSPGTAATAVVDMLIHCPLFLSPLYFGCACGDNQGFYNVNSMDFNLTFLSAAGFRMWSHNPVAIPPSGANQIFSNITGITAQFSNFSTPFSYPQNQPQLLFKYITPNVLSKERIGPNIPMTYPYFDITRFPTDIGTLSHSTPSVYQSNNIQLNQIPRRMYIYGRPANSVLTSRCDITDTYLAISNVSVQFANQSTLLSSATKEQLFQINCKNHCEMSWNEWSGDAVNNTAFKPASNASPYGTTGGPLCLEFGSDIQIDQDQAPGLAGQFQIQVQVTLTNKNITGAWDAIPFTLYLVFVNEGTFTITSTGSAQHQLGVLSTMDVLNSQDQPGMNYRKIQGINGGGDFWGSLSNFGSKINDFLKQSKIISSVASLIPHPIAQVGSQIAKNVGYGEGGCDMGGVAVGGRFVSKKQMQKALMYK